MNIQELEKKLKYCKMLRETAQEAERADDVKTLDLAIEGYELALSLLKSQ